jgi:hypothetical protein
VTSDRWGEKEGARTGRGWAVINYLICPERHMTLQSVSNDFPTAPFTYKTSNITMLFNDDYRWKSVLFIHLINSVLPNIQFLKSRIIIEEELSYFMHP